MRKRSRRGKGKGKKAAVSTPSVATTNEVVPPITISTSGAIDKGTEQVFSTSNADAGPSERSSYGAVTGSSKTDSNELNEYNLRKLAVTQQSDGTLILRSSNPNRIVSTGSQSSDSTSGSVDGDGDADGAGSDTTGDNESNEPLHTGFMQTGPNCYRAGSTVVNLNNCSEEDVSATFKDNDICLVVECGDNKGSMFMSKLYQGSKGKCIESNGVWYTPNEFQVMSGRGSAKDWKRSIRHQGRSLKLLLSKDVLDVHPAACRCDSCRQLEIMNAKSAGGTASSTAVEPSKSGSGGDTSGEDNNKRGLFNGSTTLAKKRKKGRPPASSSGNGPAAKSAKITTAQTPGSNAEVVGPESALTSSTKLEPVSITIPGPSPVPEEDKMVPLPNLDSPLFKDVPSKKDSSSDSSSSGSSSSDDSSSSEEDSDDEESKKEPTSPGTMDVIPSKADPQSVMETPKARTPIKLTISNVGKPSAKVTSSSSRELVESNSSDSEWDNEDSNSGKKVNNSEAKELFSSNIKEASSPLRWKPVSLNPTSERGDIDINNVSSKLWENSPTPITDSNSNMPPYDTVQDQNKFHNDVSVVSNSTNSASGTENTIMTKSDDSISSGFTSVPAAVPTQDLPNHVVGVTTNVNQNINNNNNDNTPVQGSTGCENLNVSLTEDKDKSFDEDSLLKDEEEVSIDSGLKNLDEDFLLKDDVDSNVGSFTRNDSKDKVSDCEKMDVDNVISSNDSSDKPSHGVLNMDYESVSNSKDSKYCPDGFILAPTLSKSPEHLRSPLKYGPCPNGNLISGVDNCENVLDTPKNEIADTGEEIISSENCVDIKNSMSESKGESNEKKIVNSMCIQNDAIKDIPQNSTATKEDPETLETKSENVENVNTIDFEMKSTTVLEINSSTYKAGENSQGESIKSTSSSPSLSISEIPSTNQTTATTSSVPPLISQSTFSTVTTDSTTSAVNTESKIITNNSDQLSVTIPDANKDLSQLSPLPFSSCSAGGLSPQPSSSSSVKSPNVKSSLHPSTSPTPATSTPESVLSAPSCSASSLSPSASSNSTTATTTATATSSTKKTGCTNGIPDKENPFITWTKYDDDNSGPIDSHLPPSSLVQALARSPFPPLPLPSNAQGSQISPLRSTVPQLSPLGLSAPIPHLASPGSQQRSGMSPSQGSPGSATSQSGRLSASIEGKGNAEQGKQPVQKSAKRGSRLTNIIDTLRSTKEKQVSSSPAPKEPPNQEQAKRSALDALFGLSQSAASSSANLSSSSSTSSSSNHPKPSSHSSASASGPQPPPIVPPLLPSKDPSLRGSEKIHQDSLIIPSQISSDTRHAIRSSLDAARAQAVNESFNALKDDLDKGKRILENLELMKNGIMDSPYGKQSLVPDQKQQRSRLDSSSSSSSQLNRGRASSSTPTTASSSSSSLPRPSSRQSSKLPINNQQQSHSSSSSSSSSMATSLPSASKSSSSSSNMASNSLGNNMYQAQAAPSAALTAAHMELNAAAANIMAMQHMYGMQDPYFMKALMSNPMYLQRMMEFQKQAMDPMMLRQLELLEAAALADKTKNSKDQRAALNAQNLLWSAQAATMLQHQQMQQLQQMQLHHQQQQMQQQQQAVAAKEKESLDTIAALMANKSNNFHSSSSSSSSSKGINSGSISTGQSSKFVAPSSSSSSASSSIPNNKRVRSNAPTPTLPSNSYSREAALSAEKKARLQSSSHHQSNSSGGYSNSPSSSSLSSSSSSNRSSSSHPSNKQAGTSGSSSAGSNSSSSATNRLLYPTTKQDYQDLQAQLNASAAAAGMWGIPPGMTPQQQMDMLRMSRYFEQQQQQQHQQQQQQQQQPPQRQREGASSSSTTQRGDGEAVSGAEVLDLSVKPRGKV